MKYEADGVVDSKLFGNPKLHVESYSYKYLCQAMAEATIDLRFYTEGVNSSSDGEGYTKDLIWPEVKWKIKRVKK